ncbi:R3H domain-containing protein 1 [Linum grandiflorum]
MDSAATENVDSFLVEALQNPRHRLTILRMELEVQRFLQNSEKDQFEFQHLPTSYLRLAAHRVAHHYGLATMVQEGMIVVRKQAERRNPPVRLADIPAKHPESDEHDQVKIAIKARPKQGSLEKANGLGDERGPVKSVEERKEEYERARARIFSTSPTSPPTSPTSSEDALSDGSSSRVAILRDQEKDRYDPDYNRGHQRYVGGALNQQGFNMLQYNLQNTQLPYFPQSATGGYYSPYCAVGWNQAVQQAGAYVQWPTAPMMYAHSYEQFCNQAPFFQQPLTFDYSQGYY